MLLLQVVLRVGLYMRRRRAYALHTRVSVRRTMHSYYREWLNGLQANPWRLEGIVFVAIAMSSPRECSPGSRGVSRCKNVSTSNCRQGHKA